MSQITTDTTTTPTAQNTLQPRRWLRPDADLYEGKDGFRLELDVPGVTRENLKVHVERHVLTVEAARNAQVGYQRRFELTDLVDTENITAELNSGVLTLTLPRARTAEPRRIAVRGA